MSDAMLAAVLRPGPAESYASPRVWWAAHRAHVARLESPFERAVVGATHVDRLGFAFAGGYANALRALVPSLAPDVLASFAATEARGGHPRAIETTLDDGVLSGRKRWVTLGPDGGVLLVVARVPSATEAPHPTLRVVRVDASAPGVRITPLPAAPFVPEIPHAELALDGVLVEPGDVLPGDGYTAYLKPFRTVEDVHVHGALLGFLVANGVRAGWPRPLVASLVAALLGCRAIAALPPGDAETHVALAGLLTETRALVEQSRPHWPQVSAAFAEHLDRDRPLLDVAAKAREARTQSAWEKLSEKSTP